MKPLVEIAEAKNLAIVEDCAQSTGAKIKSKKVPFCGIGAFSFFPTKPLGCFGDGGAIAFNDATLFEKIIAMRCQGFESGKISKSFGINSRLDTIQAAVLLEKMKIFEKQLQKRQNVAEIYCKNLSEQFFPQKILKNSESSFSLFSVLAEEREKTVRVLKSKKIGFGIYYGKPLNQHDFFRKNFGIQHCPNAEMVSKQIVSLPFFAEISEKEILAVCDALKRV